MPRRASHTCNQASPPDVLLGQQPTSRENTMTSARLDRLTTVDPSPGKPDVAANTRRLPRHFELPLNPLQQPMDRTLSSRRRLAVRFWRSSGS